MKTTTFNDKIRLEKEVTMHSEDKSALWKILKKLRFFLSSLIRPFQLISLLQQLVSLSPKTSSLTISLSLRFSGSLWCSKCVSLSHYKVLCLFHLFSKTTVKKHPCIVKLNVDRKDTIAVTKLTSQTRKSRICLF